MNQEHSINPQHLKKFDQLKGLPWRVLKHIAGETQIKVHQPGEQLVAAGASDPMVHLLLRGEIQLVGANGSKVNIKAGSDNGSLPISSHLPKGSHIQALDQVTTLGINQELFHSIQRLPKLQNKRSHYHIEHETVETKQTSIFWDFYTSIREGKLKLPNMPTVTTKIAKVVNNPDTDNHDIARVIQADPSMAARIISVVNSAAYRGQSPIDNLPDAVSRLGRKVTHNLVTGFALGGLFCTRSVTLKKLMTNAWKHASQVAAICHELARVTPDLDPDQAMLCGLVHDIGILPILEAARERPGLLEDPAQLEQIIDNLKGEIGALVLKEWGFTDSFVQAALHAEDWMEDINDKPDYVDLVVVAQLHAYIGTPMMSELPRLDLTPAFHKLALGKLTPRHSLGILDNAQENIQEMKELLAGN